MASELEELKGKADELARVASDRPEGVRAHLLVERLDAGRFLLAVVGEFKRGKSTLVNALVAEPVLPTGVLPLTAVATELAFGEAAAAVKFLDGRIEAISRDQIASYVTEAGNPGNGRGVDRVEVRGSWGCLSRAWCWWTPLAWPRCTSTTPRRVERRFSTRMGRSSFFRRMRRFPSKNSIWYSFCATGAHRPSSCSTKPTISDQTSWRRSAGSSSRRSPRSWASRSRSSPSMRGARSGLATGQSEQSEGMEFGSFLAEMARFISDDLDSARALLARNQLARLGSALSDAVAIERAARKLADDDLGLLVERFDNEATRQRQGFEDDRTLLARDAAALLDDIGEMLAGFAESAPPEYDAALRAVAAAASRSWVIDDLQDTVRAAVEASFDELRRTELAEVEGRWNPLAVAFRRRVQPGSTQPARRPPTCSTSHSRASRFPR
jgi:hypothetical protein